MLYGPGPVMVYLTARQDLSQPFETTLDHAFMTPACSS
jgi:hypothetical protein